MIPLHAYIPINSEYGVSRFEPYNYIIMSDDEWIADLERQLAEEFARRAVSYTHLTLPTTPYV